MWPLGGSPHLDIKAWTKSCTASVSQARTPGERGLYGNPFLQTRGQKSYWPIKMEPSRAGWPRASRSNIYHGRCALERRSSVPQRRDSRALVLAHLLRGLILGKSLTDSEPQFPPLSDGLQLALPISPRPLGEGHRESGGNIVGNGGSSSASGGKRKPRLGVS